MAEISKSGTPSLCSVLPPQASTTVGLLAGEAIAAFDACYIKSDGTVWRSTGAAATAPAKVRGFAATTTDVGEAVTLLFNVNVNYGSALTPGANYYLSGTVVGGLADTASTGGVNPIAYAIDTKRIHIGKSNY